ncbi:MAG: APC family permease, partial [Lentihominibacter sp.]
MNDVNGNMSFLRGDNSKIVAKDIRIPTMIFMIYSFCCGGAFGVEEMISSGGPGLTIILLAALPIVWALPQALTAAELGSAIPYTGGFYKWNQAALGEFWGFTAGYGRVIAQYLEMPGYVILCVSYIGYLLPLNGVEAYLLKAAIIILFTIVNLRGIKEVGWIATVISTFILIAFAGIALIGFTHMEQSPFEPIYNPEEGFLFSLGGALALGMWMYSGFTSVSTLAGDVKDKSVVWKSLLIALPIIALTYILPTAAGVGAVGNWQEWGSDSVNYGTVAGLVGLSGAFIFVAIIGNASCFNTCMASLSRNFYAICEDNLGPKMMVKMSKKRSIPYISVLSIAIVALIGCTFNFETIITITVTMLMVDYTLIWISLVALRIKHPEMKRPFKIPVKSVPGIIAFVSPGWIVCIIAIMVNGADYFLGGMIGIAVFPLLYIFFKLKYGGLTKLYPDLHPMNPKTKLAYGDLTRFAKLFGVLTVLSFAATFFMPYYEGSWGPEYYADVYGSQGAYDFILSGITVVT